MEFKIWNCRKRKYNVDIKITKNVDNIASYRDQINRLRRLDFNEQATYPNINALKIINDVAVYILIALLGFCTWFFKTVFGEHRKMYNFFNHI